MENTEVVEGSLDTEVTPNTEFEQMVLDRLENIDTNNAQTYMLVQDNLPHFIESSNLLSLYGLVLVPLIVVVLMLNWFFKQFLQKY